MRDLSEREIECCRWMSEGKLDHEIAQILGLSYHTCKSHIRTALIKTDTHTRPQLVVWLYDRGILKPKSRSASST